MKRILLILILNLFVISCISQERIPSVNIKTLDGKTINTASFSNNGDPIIISFGLYGVKTVLRNLKQLLRFMKTGKKILM